MVPEEKKDISNVPSALRRPVFVSSPTTAQPQQQAQARPPTMVTPPPQRPQETRVSSGGGSLLITGISVLAVLLAILSLLLASFTTLSYFGMKGEVKAISEDLKKIRDTKTSINTPLQGTVVIDRELEASEALPSTLTFPVKFTLIINDTVSMVVPGQGVRPVPIYKEIPVEQVVTIDFAKAGKGKQIVLRTSIPIDTTVSAKVSGNDLWKTELNDIITRLEKIGS
ncbi:hypothetical protein HY570_00225 [Candidatus Micrarchaeota archaeon]|nr:hypothetical protein [Candidatus Micrarchaeota archaeon]